MGESMTVDLAVETTFIRQAACVLDDASSALHPGMAGDMSGGRLVDNSLGNTALGREVVAAANRRVPQAVEAAGRLAGVVANTADKLRTVAAAFEAAESSTIGPPR